MRVYVAGPMTGLPGFNFDAFHRAEALLVVHGYEVFNPARKDLEKGFNPAGLTGHENLTDLGFDLREALGMDTAWICEHAEAVYMLPGWAGSKGATAERALALALGLEVWGAPC